MVHLHLGRDGSEQTFHFRDGLRTCLGSVTRCLTVYYNTVYMQPAIAFPSECLTPGKRRNNGHGHGIPACGMFYVWREPPRLCARIGLCHDKRTSFRTRGWKVRRSKVRSSNLCHSEQGRRNICTPSLRPTTFTSFCQSFCKLRPVLLIRLLSHLLHFLLLLPPPDHLPRDINCVMAG